jgi:AAA domain
MAMARMIPESCDETTESPAERRLFERIRDTTGDELVAFHSVAWLVRARGRPRQGEADFVLAHPEYGAVAVEVKGGGIRYDATTGKWCSAGRDREVFIKDPARQAQNAMFRLRDLMTRSARGGGQGVALGSAVCFPDTRVDARSLRVDLPREIVIDHRDLRKLEARLDALFRYWYDAKDDQPLGADGIERLERLLANSFQLRAPLGYEYEEEERELLRLTEQQYRVLDMLARHTRVAIAGCAGSGKTFLAAEKARRLAEQGFRVLLVCFNRFLAEHLRQGVADVDEIDAFSYDALALSIVREAGADFPAEPPEGDQGEYWRSLRHAFADCVEVAAGRYGALIVDEAQDFQEDWWLPLQLMLEDPDRSPLYVFFDDNQRIFAVPKNLPVSGEPIELTINCRNTKKINALVTAFYKGGSIEALGPEGPPIDRHFYATDGELLEQLDASIRMWIEQAEVRPDDIALLTAKSPSRSALWTVETLGGVRLTEDPWEADRILRSSIHRFKGLERLVVAVTELEGARSDVFYVGFSRPNVFLSVFCPESARHRLPRELVA